MSDQLSLFDVPPSAAERQRERDAETRDTQRRRVLDLLRAGPKTGNELDRKVGRRFGARIHELRKHGFEIETRRIENGHGDYLYTLTKETAP